MPTIKNSFERHKVLDRCFRDKSRKYFLEDLIRIVNEDTFYYYGTNVSKRTIQNDISYMKDSEGYSAPIAKKMDGHRAYYFYSDDDFSILNLPMSQQEMELLANTINMLNRFKGLPDLSWMEQVLVRFQDTFHLTEAPSGIVSFQQNQYLHGLHHFSTLFDAIARNNVLEITYHKFRKPPTTREIHPYQLRQYNNRWFLIGMEPKFINKISLVTVPLDRIDEIKIDENKIFQSYSGGDINDYFSQIVGVSMNINSKKEQIVIKATYPAAAYINSKPFHNSQTIIEQDKDYIVFELSLIPNYEFETILLGFLDECEVIKPLWLKQKMAKRAEKILKNNG